MYPGTLSTTLPGCGPLAVPHQSFSAATLYRVASRSYIAPPKMQFLPRLPSTPPPRSIAALAIAVPPRTPGYRHRCPLLVLETLTPGDNTRSPQTEADDPIRIGLGLAQNVFDEGLVFVTQSFAQVQPWVGKHGAAGGGWSGVHISHHREGTAQRRDEDQHIAVRKRIDGPGFAESVELVACKA